MSIKVTKRNGVHCINPTLTIGEFDMELGIKVTMDGEVIIDKKSDSLLSGLLRIFMSSMGGLPDVLDGIPTLKADHNVGSTLNWQDIVNDYADPITVAETYAGGKTKITTGTTQLLVVGDQVQIWGLLGDWKACNGVHIVVDDLSTTEFTILVDSSAFGAVSYSGLPYALRHDHHYLPSMPHLAQLDYNQLWLGKGADAVNIDDRALKDQIHIGTGQGQLQWTDAIIDPSTVAINISTGVVTITFSRDFVNNSVATVPIEEAALYTMAYRVSGFDTWYWNMAARDLISTSIAAGGLATVSYTIKTTLDAEGGFLVQMLKAWAGQSVTQTQNDIEGVARSESGSALIYRMIGTSGGMRHGTAASYYDGGFIGPQVGTGNTAVQIDDYALETRIDSGDGSDLAVAGAAGQLRITIGGVNYDEAFATSNSVTATNWVTSHAATLFALGTPITVTDDGAGVIHVTSGGTITIVDNSSGGMSFVIASQLKIYGAVVDNFLVNVPTGECSFDITRIFENNSGVTIVVNEVGLYYSPDTDWRYVYNITRHVLAAPITILDGELLKLTHTIKVVL